MITIQLAKTGSTWVCKDGEAILYYGDAKTSNGKNEFIIRNAYQEEILRFAYAKGGFKLFRSNKPVNFTFDYEGKEGNLDGKERTYEWRCGDVHYTFVLGMHQDSFSIILRDLHETIGCASGSAGVMTPLYSAELCGVWMLMQEVKDRVLMEDDKFMRAYKEAKSVCV